MAGGANGRIQPGFASGGSGGGLGGTTGGGMRSPEWGNAGYPDSGWGGGPDWNVQNPGMPGGGQYPKEGVAGDVAVPGVGISEAAPDPWAGISQGRLGQARRFANVGQFGRAKQQIGLGGGNWDDVGGLLRTEAAANPYVKGQSMGFDWGDTSAGRLAEAKKMAASGKMGRAKQQFELGGGTWSPQMSHQMRAWQKGNK